MRRNTRVTFAMRDLDRLKCIQAVIEGDLKPLIGLVSQPASKSLLRQA
jgi:hypothetical protein